MKLTTAPSIVMTTSLEEFHPNRKKGVENPEKISLEPLSGVCFGCTEFYDT
jgi:hypothetical protein